MGLVFFLLMIIGFTIPYFEFKKSTYKTDRNFHYWKFLFNKGQYGEYLTYRILEKLKGHHKLLNNLYVPRDDGTTTEIDLMMIDETGIYVFESKNYSGWIFGDERNKNWIQSMKNGKKFKFYNPVIQNKGHIKSLQSFLSKDNPKYENNDLYKSYIVFSDRCELKKIKVRYSNVQVMKRFHLKRKIQKGIKQSTNLLSKEEINDLYLKLKPLTEVDDLIKYKHLKRVRNMK